MPEIVRFNVDHHQLRLVVGIMDGYLSEQPSGELHNFMHSIIAQQVLALKRKLLLQRLQYRLSMPVHFALAFRRMVLVAQEVLLNEQSRLEMLLLIQELDPITNRYTHVHQ